MTADNSALLSFVSKAKTKSYKQPEWKHPKPCIVCGELFLPYQKKSVVCSQDCRLVHVANNSSGKWQVKDYPEVNCQKCNAVFKPRQKDGKYCSAACNRKRPRHILINCLCCKKEVKRTRRGSNDSRQYCSKQLSMLLIVDPSLLISMNISANDPSSNSPVRKNKFWSPIFIL